MNFNILKLCLAGFLGFAATQAAPTKSQYDFDKTTSNITSLLAQKNIPIFAEFDHSANAQKAGLELRPTKVIVFGNPKVGTLLMQENQALAFELPLRVLVWQDLENNVWVEATDMQQLAQKYGIQNAKVVQNISKLLAEILHHSTGNQQR